MYTGGGYAPIIAALRIGEPAVTEILDAHPDLVNEVTSGGATPLHMCGMSRRNQQMTALLIERGGDMEAVDAYGYRPLHRMASNNLAIGAAALIKAGADPKVGKFVQVHVRLSWQAFTPSAYHRQHRPRRSTERRP